MSEVRAFGRCAAGEAAVYTIRNKNGMEAELLSLGAALRALRVPAEGGVIDVVLGYDTAEDYFTGRTYFGALIGRVANRIGGAGFTLDGRAYTLAANNGKNCLHGGREGFSFRIWRLISQTESELTLGYEAQDGEEGFPGALSCTVRYRLREDDALEIAYEAVPAADTIAAFTNHAYFNLNGGGDVRAHTLRVCADHYTESDAELIPTGRVLPVAGTALDYRQEKPLGRDFNAPMLRSTAGLDHNFCLRGEGLREAGTLTGERLSMQVLTDCPGMQVYCAPFRTPKKGKNGASYEGYCFCCMETQCWPDAVHHEGFPSIVRKAGEVYRTTTVYRFTKK